MLSYLHAYHAGNAADLHKHGALAALLGLLTQKDRGITYIETHAGRGLYDLGSAEAAKTGEAARGIGRHVPEGRFAEVLAGIRAQHGETAYPGSPLIARAMLRPQDRMILCELHPAEHAALSTAVGNAEIHRRDGHEALPALCPPKPRRGLVLVDPSYEVKTEYVRTAETVLRAFAKWPEAVMMIWFPLLPEGRHTDLLAPLHGLSGLRIDMADFAERPPRGMTGSGLAFVNLPHGAGAALDAARAACAPVLNPKP